MSSPGGVAMPVSPHSPLSPTTAGALSLDYAAAGYPAAAAAQIPTAYEAAYPYTTGASYVSPATYQAYAAAAAASVQSAQPTISPFAASHYQAQQLQERMQ